MIEQTLLLVKPDGVQRGLIGEVITRLEKVGLKIIALKLTKIDENFAEKHYHDVEERHGKKILQANVNFVTSGPIIAMILEGVDAIENVRKIIGSTEPKSAAIGTIRGDYTHMSYGHADETGIPTKNVVHASADKSDAEREIALWFSIDEMHEYKTASEPHVR
jgi:nucleoside-diphosphate kinase